MALVFKFLTRNGGGYKTGIRVRFLVSKPCFDMPIDQMFFFRSTVANEEMLSSEIKLGGNEAGDGRCP